MIKLLLRIPLIALIVFPYAAVGLLLKGKLLAMALTALVLYVYPFIASRFLAPKALLFWALTAKIVSIPVFCHCFFHSPCRVGLAYTRSDYGRYI